MTRIIPSLAAISDQYEALFVDLWGCVHNGIAALPEAVAALQSYRARGGTVVLVTNSPKPRIGVEAQLKHFGVPDDAWDSIATSGDSARAAMFQGVVGKRIYFIGLPHDLPFFDPIQVVSDPVEITRVSLDQAEGIVCTGPFDGAVDPAVLLPELRFGQQKALKLLCANPDLVVDRGTRREWCAGAVAQLYQDIGGQSLYFGKPHAPIYDLARKRLKALGKALPDSAILAIGDGAQTDISGARDASIDALFITGGLAAQETQTRQQPDPSALAEYLDSQRVAPAFSIGFLR
ncbi:MAG TPA: TIGR01459 family HAD-type hydrolase [Rhodobacteraceae bacterium]|nr:TIGR01459 family HAD-type hydrolase [Paracoccaceae bacterium]